MNRRQVDCRARDFAAFDTVRSATSGISARPSAWCPRRARSHPRTCPPARSERSPELSIASGAETAATTSPPAHHPADCGISDRASDTLPGRGQTCWWYPRGDCGPGRQGSGRQQRPLLAVMDAADALPNSLEARWVGYVAGRLGWRHRAAGLAMSTLTSYCGARPAGSLWDDIGGGARPGDGRRSLPVLDDRDVRPVNVFLA